MNVYSPRPPIVSLSSRYVELLDKYFGSVCELDIIFNYEKAYFMLDELLLVRRDIPSPASTLCLSLSYQICSLFFSLFAVGHIPRRAPV